MPLSATQQSALDWIEENRARLSEFNRRIWGYAEPAWREYKSARAMDLLAAKTRGMDAYMNQHKLDAVLFASSAGAAIAAKAGYPSVMVPGGFISGSPTTQDTPDYPLGVTFAGRAWSEHKLLRLAYAYEQASNMRKPPPGFLDL